MHIFVVDYSAHKTDKATAGMNYVTKPGIQADLSGPLSLQRKTSQVPGEEEDPHLPQRQPGRECDGEQPAWHSGHPPEPAAAPAAAAAARGHDPGRAAEDERPALRLLHWPDPGPDPGRAPGCHALLLGWPARGMSQ